MKQTKIVASVSDLRCEVEFIKQLYEAGVNVIRMNTAHATPEGLKKIISNVRAVSPHLGILIDTKGPEVRTTGTDAPIEYHIGERVNIVGNPAQDTVHDTICLSYPDICKDVKVGDDILFDDGELDMQVVENDGNKLTVEVMNDGKLGSHKSVNVPGEHIDLPALTEKDKRNILLAIEENIDFIAHSFVRSKEDLKEVQKILDEHGSDIKIISKIENQEGVDNIDEILDHCYGIMVARGDLGLNTPLEEVPIHQKEIIKKCRNSGKAVIVATQMLNNMQSNPQPTRAEVSDIFMAINESADAIMLSGETASGMFPSESVEMQKNIAITSEKYLDYKKLLEQNYTKDSNAIANSIGSAALLSKAKAIIAFTNNINSVQCISKARPICPIIFVSNDRNKILKSSIYWGVYGYFYDSSFPKTTDIKKISFDIGKKIGLKENDPFIVTSNFNNKIEDNLDFMYISHIKDNDE